LNHEIFPQKPVFESYYNIDIICRLPKLGVHMSQKFCFALIIFFGLCSFATIDENSLTYDEPYHVAAAAYYWQFGHTALGDEQPVISRLVQGPLLRLNGFGEISPQTEPFSYSQFTAIANFFLTRENVDFITRAGRLPSVVLLMLSAWLIFLITNRLANNKLIALSTVVFFISNPTIRAHYTLISTDCIAASALLFFVWSFARYQTKGTYTNFFLATLAASLCLGAKYYFWIILPLCYLLLLVERLLTERWTVEQFLTSIRKILLLVAGAIGLLWAADGFYLTTLRQPFSTEVARYFTELTWVKTWLNTVPVPLSSAFYGLDRMFYLNNLGKDVFFLGGLKTNGSWLYFPLLMIMKTPVLTVISTLIGFLLFICKSGFSRDRNPLFWAIWVCLFAMTLPLIFSAINIGLRHALPSLALSTLGVTYLLEYIRQRTTSRVFHTVVVAAGLILLFENRGFLKDPIPYFNDLTPSPHSKMALDSNLDWGQDLKRLNHLSNNSEIEALCLRYFGTVSAGLYIDKNWQPIENECDTPHYWLVLSKSALNRSTEDLDTKGIVTGSPRSFVIYNK
jgi:hypothetical protein